jgi:hypothetical protein
MKNYPPQFKADAVVLYRSRPEATIRQAAADLGHQPGNPAELADLIGRDFITDQANTKYVGAVLHSDHGPSTAAGLSPTPAAKRASPSPRARSAPARTTHSPSRSTRPANGRPQGRRAWDTEHEAHPDLFRWLHRYNTIRRHYRLGHRSPIAFE